MTVSIARPRFAPFLRLGFLCQDETLEQVEPGFILFARNVKGKVDTHEELSLHAVDLAQVDSRDFGPRLVGVRVAVKRLEDGKKQKGRDILVQKLVCHHQGSHRDAKLTPGETGGETVALLETPNVVQGKHDDGLADLGRLKQLLHKLHKCRRRIELQGGRGRRRLGRIGGRGHVGPRACSGGGSGGKPQVTDHLAGLFCDEAGGPLEGGIEPVDDTGRVARRQWLLRDDVAVRGGLAYGAGR